MWHVTALVSGCRGPLHLPICMLDRDLAATGDRAGRGCRETPGLGFEQEPGLGAGMDDRPAPVPAGPRSVKAVPRPAGALSWAEPPGAAVPRVAGFEDIVSRSWPARGGSYRCPTLSALRDALSLTLSSPRMFLSTREKAQAQQRGRQGG